MSRQIQIIQTTPLLKSDGYLNTAGWSPQPMLDSNLEDAHFYRLHFLQPLRMKRWDYYGVTTPTHFFSFTISDIGYLGMVFAYVVDFTARSHHEETLTLPFGGGVQIPRNSDSGITHYASKNVQLTFDVQPGKRSLKVNWENFENGLPLIAEIGLDQPADHESMNLVIPIEQKRFYFNRKINCMPASGRISYQGKEFSITPKTCLGNLDWGRGVWAYESFWVWASSSGFCTDGRRVGLNLGYGFGDTSAATENAFILEGKIHKLGKVDFNYTSGDFMKPWQMQSDDGRLSLTFTPFYDRTAKTDIKLLYSEVHQMFGEYNGTLMTDQGETVTVQSMKGFAEEHHARW
ncbi:MAG: hypothetical protein CVU39_13005 [Chloroflexi bacterium HGW-Chloroflexi-10]|nr:MAG: hypothetical protein CVU39_13005 [Chloroflexi bacterium HGW-Chloroflexi-10]